MKIRNGFVSNSSSSSFILLGCKITNYDNFKESPYNAYDGYEGFSIRDLEDDNMYFVLTDSRIAFDDYSIVGAKIDKEEIDKLFSKYEELKHLGLNPPEFVGGSTYN